MRRVLQRKGNDNPRRRRSLAENLLWGAKHGLSIAIVFTIWISVLFFIGGSTAFEKNHTTFQAVVALYLIGGPIAGAIVGLFRPGLQKLGVAILAGSTAAIPLAAGVRLAMFGLEPLSGRDVFLLFVFGLALGPATAVAFWIRRDRLR